MLGHLHGQFTRGDEHQGVYAARFILQQTFNNGNQEGQRLAGAGLGRCQDVLSCERLRNGRGLHGSRRGEARRRKAVLAVLRNL